MPRIRCHYLDCVFLDEKYCSAAAVEIDPEGGCLTYVPNEETEIKNWEDEEELDDWDDIDSEDEDEDLWIDDEDDELDSDADEY